jgi:hypothetical protein
MFFTRARGFCAVVCEYNVEGPKLFFTSAKTGEGVNDVFEYIARRVVMRWEYEELIDEDIARARAFRNYSAGLIERGIEQAAYGILLLT